MFGFDLWNDGSNNNLYPRDNKPISPKAWIYQTAKIFELHPTTTFIQVQPQEWKVPEEWQGFENFGVDTAENVFDQLDIK